MGIVTLANSIQEMDDLGIRKNKGACSKRIGILNKAFLIYENFVVFMWYFRGDFLI